MNTTNTTQNAAILFRCGHEVPADHFVMSRPAAGRAALAGAYKCAACKAATPAPAPIPAEQVEAAFQRALRSPVSSSVRGSTTAALRRRGIN